MKLGECKQDGFPPDPCMLTLPLSCYMKVRHLSRLAYFASSILQEDADAVLLFVIGVSIGGWEMTREDCGIGEKLNVLCVKLLDISCSRSVSCCVKRADMQCEIEKRTHTYLMTTHNTGSGAG
ncbi:hypothetical protein WOLCODRAFT_25570 [Wolfiporia cocos MD-104 SS10]|uniref:Uncharacterized protein n=1 Tax=Wolfiporia cocos (strain MD-104) TaxID=742152 RepID=A0A2H3JKU0_WOLCO|nr:hypothetical protein WOLCODRAFT_25570 [Wolfiporia cocos MD-104 SS10]